MKKKKCNHISFWTIYTLVNFRRVFYKKKWLNFKCSHCKEECNLRINWRQKWDNLSIKSIWKYILWLLIPVLLIILVADNQMDFRYAILIVILYHFLAMFYIINYSKLLKIKAK